MRTRADQFSGRVRINAVEPRGFNTPLLHYTVLGNHTPENKMLGPMLMQQMREVRPLGEWGGTVAWITVNRYGMVTGLRSTDE